MFLQIVKVILSVIIGIISTIGSAMLIDAMTVDGSGGTGDLAMGLLFLIILVIVFFFSIGLGYYLLGFLF